MHVVSTITAPVPVSSREELRALIHSLDNNATIADYAQIAYLCGEHRALREARQLHAKALQLRQDQDSFLARNIVKMFLKCGSLIDANSALETMIQEPDVSIWTETIAEHARRRLSDEALKLFRRMQLNGVTPNKITFLAVLNACTKLSDLQDAHGKIVEYGFEANPMLATTLIHKYSKLGSSDDARRVFDGVRDLMVTAYARDGFYKEPLKLFRRMQMEGIVPDKITFLAVLDSCQDERALETGKLVHGMILEAGLDPELDLSTGLISMYSKCGNLQAAESIFAAAARQDDVLCTAMIEARARRGSCRDALGLLMEMHQHGVKPGKITFAAALDASAGRASSEELSQLHAAAARSGLQDDIDVATALVNSYGKSGLLDRAREIFDKMEKRSVITWSALISGYSHHGRVREVVQLFEAMQLEGLVPSLVTFLCVLSACSHRGLVYKTVTYFTSMTQDYGLRPLSQHYGCLIDMFGRSGQAGHAGEVVERMPLEPDPEAWMALLRACHEWENVRLGEHAGKSVLELDPEWESGYVNLSSVYVVK